MATADKSIDPRILDCAKAEFLAKGYLGASLAEICGAAGVTTGALYKRYKGKEDLFAALVDGTIEDLGEIVRVKRLAPERLSDDELIRAWDMDREYMLWWFRYLYDRYDAMRLLLTRSEGTKYSGFEHEWVEAMRSATCAYYREAYRRGLTHADVSEREMHVMLSAFWMTIYEPIVHGFSWEDVSALSDKICDLFDWYKLLGFPKG